MKLLVRSIWIAAIVAALVVLAAASSYEVRRKLRAGWAKLENLVSPERR